MKTILVTVLFIYCQISLAQSFTIIQNGKNYLCQEQGLANPTPTVGSDCELAAIKNSRLTNGEAAYLCAGVYTTGASDCVAEVYNINYTSSSRYQILNKNQSIELCEGAQFPYPSDCLIGVASASAYNSPSSPFSNDEIVSICKKTGNKLLGDCVGKKYHDITFEYTLENIREGKKNTEVTQGQVEEAKAKAISFCK